MIPYKTIIKLDRESKQALFLQLSSQIVELIKSGTLTPKSKLPGSRALSEMLGVHRKTIIASYEELSLQGWIETLPQKGTYVNANLPVVQYRDLNSNIKRVEREKTGFLFKTNKHYQPVNMTRKEGFMYFDDGVSDSRLTPTDEIAILYRSLISKKQNLSYLSYNSTYGNLPLRKVLANYLNDTRGLKITEDNVLITRGSQMGIHLSSQLIVSPGDYVIVGDTNYSSADITFLKQGARLIRITVDENGLKTDEIAAICEKYPIKALYVTSHHHHPTTVTLSAERRIELLNLAKRYQFAIIEDDYDYDFHYEHSPILPLASHDQNGNVIYIGSVCKLIAPVFRVGYLIAPKAFVDECANARRYIDRQGDSILELTFAHFIKNGNLDRHIKKVIKIYKERRDLMCTLLQSKLKGYVDFTIPKGGMAVWLKLNKKYSWEQLAKTAPKHKLEIGDYARYDPANTGHNAIRLGFARSTPEEIRELVQRLKQSIDTLNS